MTVHSDSGAQDLMRPAEVFEFAQLLPKWQTMPCLLCPAHRVSSCCISERPDSLPKGCRQSNLHFINVACQIYADYSYKGASGSLSRAIIYRVRRLDPPPQNAQTGNVPFDDRIVAGVYCHGADGPPGCIRLSACNSLWSSRAGGDSDLTD